MKNLHQLPPDLQERVPGFSWSCGCGQEGLRVSVTRKGSVQGRCFSCGRTIFWNDVGLFYMDNPFCYQDEKGAIQKAMKGGGTTTWYPHHRVRVFAPP